jgi:hypothetical protein
LNKTKAVRPPNGIGRLYIKVYKQLCMLNFYTERRKTNEEAGIVLELKTLKVPLNFIYNWKSQTNDKH